MHPLFSITPILRSGEPFLTDLPLFGSGLTSQAFGDSPSWIRNRALCLMPTAEIRSRDEPSRHDPRSDLVSKWPTAAALLNRVRMTAIEDAADQNVALDSGSRADAAAVSGMASGVAAQNHERNSVPTNFCAIPNPMGRGHGFEGFRRLTWRPALTSRCAPSERRFRARLFWNWPRCE
jgi:hypothetical protein